MLSNGEVTKKKYNILFWAKCELLEGIDLCLSRVQFEPELDW